MVDNFDLIRQNLQFLNKNSFYFVQILRRKKENPELKSYSIPVESFYIFSLEDFDKYKPHIIRLCEENRARAYIKMNCLDIESVLLKQIVNITEILRSKTWKGVASTFNSACGECGKQNGYESLYLIDLDGEFADKRNEIKEFINAQEPINVTNKVKIEVPTKNGYHFLSTGFNPQNFKKLYPNIDMHKDGITLLYFPECCC